MALIDVLNENGELTGEQKTKQEIHENGLWHAAAHVWIYNSRGEMLLQLRAKDKDSFPGLLDISAAGHIDAGETPEVAAAREVQEEIGLVVKPEQLHLIKKRTVQQPIPDAGWQNNEFDYVYLYRFDGSFGELSTPDGEVEKLEFMPVDKFEEEINNLETYKKYVPHGDYYHLVIAKIRESLGQIQ
jgi:isopentenyldiphosphate isomerase